VASVFKFLLALQLLLARPAFAEITLAFEVKSNGPLGRGMGAPRPENDFPQFKQF
jgi:hypothetical protein